MNDQKLINGKDTKGKEKHKLLILWPMPAVDGYPRILL